jgi:hypothetical protein
LTGTTTPFGYCGLSSTFATVAGLPSASSSMIAAFMFGVWCNGLPAAAVLSAWRA